MSVHPHTRGEILGALLLHPVQIGSPPHAWGDLLFALAMSKPLRFTPTRVGRSPPGSRGSGRTTVHPHTRGEIKMAALIVTGSNGSPPHAWGDRQFRPSQGRRIRFTPTRVGRSLEIKTIPAGDYD